MGLLDRVRVNLSDIRCFGPMVLSRHWARLRADRIAHIPVPGVGPVAIRAGESDIAVLRQIFAERQYDISWPQALHDRVKARYDAILSSGNAPIIVDAGANIGAASLWFSTCFPQARIVAVEPDADNVAMARRNLAGRDTCRVLEAAIGAEPGFVSLSQPDFSWAVRTERAESGVRIVTIDQALAEAGGGTPFIVKIDIEGFESDLFARNTGWIDQCSLIVIEPHDWMLPGELSSRTFQQAMASHPFELFLRGENIFYARVQSTA